MDEIVLRLPMRLSPLLSRASLVSCDASKPRRRVRRCTTVPSLRLISKGSAVQQTTFTTKSSSQDNSTIEESGVQRALIDAEDALAAAEESVSLIQTLPSAHPRHPAVTVMKWMAKRLLVAGAVFAMVYLLNLGASWLRYLSAVVFPLLVSVYSLRKGSLSPSGAVAATLVGCGTFVAGFRPVTILLSFFISSSALTKFKENTKEKALADHKKGGQRDWIQVFSNGFFATIFCIVYAIASGFQDLPLGSDGMSRLSTFMFGGVLGNYACTCGDTWASELGVLSTTTPRLITSLRPVQKGTNGGVTWLGLSASLGGGLFIGIMCYLGTLVCTLGQPLLPVAMSQWPVVVLGLVGGLMGSLVDSLLGATLQFSGYDLELKKVVNRPGDDPTKVLPINGVNILSNNQVNLISSLIMAIVIGCSALQIFH